MNKNIIAAGLVAAALTCSITACKNPKQANTKFAGVDLVNFDTTVSPGQDFFQYVNGGWLKNNPVPASESRWGSFSEVNESNMKVLLKVCEAAAADKNATAGSNKQKIGDFYATGMDSTKLEADGTKPLQPSFDRINKIADINSIVVEIANQQTMFMSPAFGFYAGQDDKNSTVIVPQFYQSGLGMPDKDYYSNQDERSKGIRDAYVKHITTLFELTGSTPAEAEQAAKAVLALETKLAAVSLSRTAKRDPNLTYNKKTIAEMDALAPRIGFAKYLEALGVNNAAYILLDNPKFMQTVNDMLASISVNDWKTYLKWNVISGSASLLNNAMVMEDFNFNEGVLKGTKEIKPRYKLVLENTDQFLGEALGELYCSEAFTPETKARALEMVNNLGIALKERIDSLDWMSPETKVKALAKLGTFINKIGYPDKWRDYSKLNIDRSSYSDNVMRAAQFELTVWLLKLVALLIKRSGV